MEDISKLKFSFYYLAKDQGQTKAVEVVMARMMEVGAVHDNFTLYHVTTPKPAAKRAGRQSVRLPRIFIGDTPKPPHNKRMTGGLAWMEGWLDAYTVEKGRQEVLRGKNDPAPDAPEEQPDAPAVDWEAGHPDVVECPHCKIKDDQILRLHEKCRTHKNEIQKAQSRIHDFKLRVTDDKLLEHDAQLQAAVGSLVGASREMVVELGAIREERAPKQYTHIGVAHAIQFCTEFLSQMRPVDQEKMEDVRDLLWHLTTLR